ncbi:6-carboxytetrahydropterin synthase QueD [Granulosicoccus sp. 3-233]|uniref:6-carboxytetrahydropterin synthase QueD n=1 Tax=Granulosicoccus sp. 3-233 TaxID=3417969 RepID=UPI003D33F83B
MFTISKQFHFSASHQLLGLTEDHPCSRLHGHNYVVEVELQAQELNQHGFVRDYHDLKELKTWIDETFDHRHLNDHFGDTPSTAENLALAIYNWCIERWPETTATRVSETPKTWAEYKPSTAS